MKDIREGEWLITVEEIEIIVTAKVEEALKEFQKILPEMTKIIKQAQEQLANVDLSKLQKAVKQQMPLFKKQIQNLKKSIENNDISIKINNKDAEKQISQTQKQIDSLNEKINARQMKLNVINPQIDKIVDDTRKNVTPEGINPNDKTMDTTVNNALNGNKDFTSLNSQAQKLYTEIEMYNKQLDVAKSKMAELKQQTSQTATTQNKLGSFFSAFKQKIEQVKPSILGVKNIFSKMPNIGQNLSKATQSITNNIKGMGTGFKNGIGQVLKYAGALFSLRGIYSALSSSANAWLSSQNSQAKQLNANIEYMKYAMGSALAPVIQFVTNCVYQLLKAVQSVVYALFRVNIFANASASAFKNAQKQAKNTSKSLSSVHSEINNVGDHNSDASPNVGDLSELNPTNSLLDAIKQGDWNSVGAIIGEKINEAMNKIPWEQIQNTAKSIGKNIADFFNGGIKTIDWNQVGNTLAQGVNTAIYLGYSFVTNFDWDSFGDAIGNTINGLFLNLDFCTAGETLSNEVMGIFTTAFTVLEAINWQEIANQIQTFFENIDFSGVANTGIQIIINLIQGLTQSLPTILTTAVTIVTSLVDGISQQMQTLIPVAINLIMTLINSILQNLPNVLIAGMEIMVSILQGLINALPELIAWIPTIIQSFYDIITNSLPQILEMGIEILVALINGLIECIPQLVEMLPQIIETIINYVTTNLPIIIDAGIKILIALIEGLTNAIPKLIEMLPQIITTIVKTLSDNFPKILEAGGKILTSLIAGIGSVLYKVGEMGWNIIKSIGDVLSQLPQKALEWGKDMIQGFINGIKNMIGNIGNAVKGVADKVKSFLHFSRPDEGPLREYEQWMPDMIKGLTKTLNNSAPQLYNASKELANKVANGLDMSNMLNDMSYNINTDLLSSDLVASINPSLKTNNITPQNIMRDTFEDVLSNYGGNSNNRPIYLTVNVGNKKLGQILLDDLRDKTRRTGKDIEALVGG